MTKILLRMVNRAISNLDLISVNISILLTIITSVVCSQKIVKFESETCLIWR
jgi:hypothetical protein